MEEIYSEGVGELGVSPEGVSVEGKDSPSGIPDSWLQMRSISTSWRCTSLLMASFLAWVLLK